MSTRSKTVWVVAITILLAGAAYASWSESFDGGKLNLSTWQFLACPDVMHTYKAFVQTAPDGNGYLVLQETSPSDVPALLGAAFGAGIGSQEVFKDVRVGATVNVGDGGDHSY